jgi:peptide/nickel transport system permease protein
MSVLQPPGEVDPLVATTAAPPTPEESEQVLRRRYVLRSLRRSPTFLVGMALLLFWVFMALFSVHVTRYGPLSIDPLHSFAHPSAAHWFGTDEAGRDVLSRTLAGASTVLVIAPLVTLLCLLVGGGVGLLSGFLAGTRDEVIMRLVDIVLALPVIVAAIVAVAALGRSIPVIILVIGLLFSAPVARTIRAAAVSESQKEYVQAARLRGEPSFYILTSEILPNILPPVIVEGTVRLGYAVFTAAGLAFLGFGVQPPSPDWGLTISNDAQYLQTAWWTVLFPALALASLVVGANLIADGVRKALAE